MFRNQKGPRHKVLEFHFYAVFCQHFVLDKLLNYKKTCTVPQFIAFPLEVFKISNLCNNELVKCPLK